MKLYYSPGACSLSPHIALHEAGLAFEPVLASTKSHKLQEGTDYYVIYPLVFVRLLVLVDGTRLRVGKTSDDELERIIAAPSPIRRSASPRSRQPHTKGTRNANLSMWKCSSAGVSTSDSSMKSIPSASRICASTK